MCRWSSMNRKEKCRCLSLVLAMLIGIGGVIAMLYGGVQMYRVSHGDSYAVSPEFAQMMAPFIRCTEAVDYQIKTGGVPSEVHDTVRNNLLHQCYASQLGQRLVLGFAAGFTILALFCAPCAFKKDKWFGFTLWSTLSIATIVMSMVLAALLAAPTASRMVDCRQYDQFTIQTLSNIGDVVCVKGGLSNWGVDSNARNIPATKWMHALCSFCGGSSACIGALLLMFMIKSCRCCNPGSCCPSPQQCGDANGEHPCPIRRAFGKFRARFCRRSNLASSVDRDDGLPVSAPTYYEVHNEAEGASEDAGASPQPNPYYGVN